MASEEFSLLKIFKDSKQVLSSPRKFFSSMPTEGGIGAPVFKALIYGIVAGFFALIWSLLNVTGFTGDLFVGATALMAFLGPIIWSVIGVFIGGVIVLIISAIAKGNNDFEANLRVAASVMVMMPIGAFLVFTAAIGVSFASLITLLINLYTLYILFFGVTQALKAEVKPARVIHFILAGILILIFLIGIGTRRSGERYSGFSSKKAEKLMKEYEKAGDEVTKEYQKALEEAEGDIEGYRIEMANGEIISKADRGDMKDALSTVGEDNEYIILREEGTFIQAMITEEGFKMRYSDKKGYFKSDRDDLSENHIEDVFSAFLKGEKKWKDKIEWEEIE
ncbi:MAG: Yip1 family protein [Bacteroidales bacterium]